MSTLKEIILVKYAAEIINDTLIISPLNNSAQEIWWEIIRRRLSAFDIPLTLKEDIIALLKPMALEVENWRADHNGIFPMRQILSLKFRFNADGTLDRIKTADSLICSTALAGETRFLLACQYWTTRNVFRIFEKIPNTLKNQILCKYSRENEYLNEHKENVVKWIHHYRSGSSLRLQPWGNFTDASLQSRRLNHLSEEDRESLLREVFEDTDKMHVGRFCLSRMSVGHREQLLPLFPQKVLRIYLHRPYLHLFMDAANKVWDQLSGKDFTCLLDIIIHSKILELWTDFDYVGLLRQFWRRSPDHLKEYVKGTLIFPFLKHILQPGFHVDVPKFSSSAEPFLLFYEQFCDNHKKSTKS
ncbi:uncharacterized protein TNCV_1125981 [Trichonephila clavipes]|nr:uncharacterized protein TNCV_1125981 [Trichonephila clavipes]